MLSISIGPVGLQQKVTISAIFRFDILQQHKIMLTFILKKKEKVWDLNLITTPNNKKTVSHDIFVVI